jgi:hypothetical protein
MDPETFEENENETKSTDLNWEQRVLCSDGNCIGVIGPDGSCKECGKKYEGTLPEDHFSAKEIPLEEDESPEKGDQPVSEENSREITELNENDESDNDDDWQNRVLCSDGNCIGVIGPDGKCKECGKPYEE